MFQRGQRFVRRASVCFALSAALVVGTGATGAPSTVHAGRVTVSTSASTIVAQKGDRSELVKQIQQKLISLGIPVSGGADGIYGTYTANAVAEFQRRKGLSQTGTVDTATAVALGVAPATPLLAKGATGDAVKAMQLQLIAVGITPAGGADGVFGSGTEAAVRQFQNAKGIPVTGQVDAATAGILANAAKGSTPSTPPPPPAAPPPLAQIGSRGAAVVSLQKDLIAVGLAPLGGADGIYGSATANSVKAFQQRVGLTVTGKYDSTTATKLTAAAAAAREASVVAKIGSRGATVVTLQKDLIAVGLSPAGGADGVYGSATANSVKAFQQRSGLPVTGVFDKDTQAKLTAAAAKAREGAAPSGNPQGTNPNGTVTLAVFPTSKRCTFIDTFGAPRSGGRTHAGVDIIAPRGTPIYAVQTGVISKKMTGQLLAGNALYLTAPDGTYFFYAHLDSFAPGISVGVPVTAGTLIGYVGSTGNAGVPHLHFEVHPRGGLAVNPYPIVRAVSGC
jgi:peptidoglycan hydrolase-like protein with peptidoglycan-binding domain